MSGERKGDRRAVLSDEAFAAMEADLRAVFEKYGHPIAPDEAGAETLHAECAQMGVRAKTERNFARVILFR